MNFMTPFLQNADSPTFLGQLALRAQTAHQVGCDFAKKTMKFNRFVIHLFFYFCHMHGRLLILFRYIYFRQKIKKELKCMIHISF